jgi:hypothetical protein
MIRFVENLRRENSFFIVVILVTRYLSLVTFSHFPPRLTHFFTQNVSILPNVFKKEYFYQILSAFLDVNECNTTQKKPLAGGFFNCVSVRLENDTIYHYPPFGTLEK